MTRIFDSVARTSRLQWATLVLLAAGAITGLPGGLAAQTLSITLADSVRIVSRPTVTVGDIARVESSSGALADRIRMIELDSVRGEQGLLEVSAEQVRYRVLLEGLPANRLQLFGPPQTLADYRSDRVVLAEVTAWLAGEAAAHRSLALHAIALEPAIDSLSPAFRRLWLNGSVESRRLASGPLEEHRLNQARIQVTDASGMISSLTIPVRLRIDPSPQPQPESPVDFRASSTASLQTVVDSQVQPATALVDDRDLVVKTPSLSPIPVRNEALSPARPADAVGRGQTIAVEHRVGNIFLKLPRAKALQSGAIGAEINVENPTTRKQFRCRIIDMERVELVR